MMPSSLLIAALAAVAITPAYAAKPPQVDDIITLQFQTLACFDLENTKELERTRAMDGLSAALHFVDRHPLPDNPAAGFTNVCSRFGPSGAITALLDRGWGKALQTHVGHDGNEIRVTIRQIFESVDKEEPLLLEHETPEK
jgi:hypothetical protein